MGGALIVFLLCTNENTINEKTKHLYESKQRIIGKDYQVINGSGYQIIQIDNIEYICSNGGICPLISGKKLNKDSLSKYQPKEKDFSHSCAAASLLHDVCTTSGPGTGMAASIDKIANIRGAIGPDKPLAIASGVSAENIGSYKEYIDYALVSTSITGSGEMIDPKKLELLVAASK